MRRLLLLVLVTFSSNAQRTFQNTQFDISGDLPVEDPSIVAQAEGVPTHKNGLKPVKLQKPIELAVLSPSNPQGPAAVQPLPPAPLPSVPAPQPTSIVQPIPQPVPVAPQSIALPTPPPMPTFATFTFAPFTFPSHPPLPTLAPFTIPSLSPQATFTFPTPAPPAGSAPVPQVSDYDDHSAQNAAPNVPATTPQPTVQAIPQPATAQQSPQSQSYFSPEYLQWLATYYPEHYRQNYQYYQYYAQHQVPAATQPAAPRSVQPAAQSQPLQLQPVPQPALPVAVQSIPPSPVATISIQPSQPVQAAGVPTQGNNQRPHVIKMEQQEELNVSPSRASNWFREQIDTNPCKKDLRKVAKLFKSKFPAYLQKGGKDAALADLVEKRLIECDEKSTTGHWDKVDSLLSKIQLSKSEESECRSGLIQERISCQNLLNFSCQFTNSNYQFKLVPARIVIQEARQAEGGAEKCRKVVRLVKKRLEG